MYNFLRCLSTFLLLTIGLGLHEVAAQTQMQYANRIVAQDGIVTDDIKAADSNLNTSAVIKPTLLLGYTRLRMSFPSVAAAGKEAGMYIKPNILISVALIGGATVNTFLNDGTTTTAVDSYLLSNNLLSLVVQSSGVTRISFMPTQKFNEIELVFFSVLALGQDISIYEAFSTVAPLPVTLTTFQAKPTPAGVALSWATASERNADQFVVERSTGSPDSFQAIGRVQCAGTTTQAHNYQFTDATATATTSYYRLRQLDLDGTETFSPVVAVQGEALTARLSAYPSPATDQLTIAGGAGTQFTILDQLGRPVQRTSTSVGRPQLDVRSLPSGLYFLQDDATGQRAKFLKAN